MKTIVHLGGRFVEEGEARVSLFDPGYLLGDGVFATMRGYDGVCFRADRHLAMLERGASLLGIELTTPRDQLVTLADECARRTGVRDAYVRVTLTRGAPRSPATLSVIARAMNVPAEDAYARGIDAITVTPRRIPPACIDSSIKTTSYVVQVMARHEVERRGAGEGVQLSVDGALAGGTMSSLFLVRGDELWTPSRDSGCRAGVTRGALLELASRVGLRAAERRLEPADVQRADEVFFASTRIECLPVARLDDRPIGRGAFPRTAALREVLGALVREETAPRRVA